MKRIVIIGSSGHARVVNEIVKSEGIYEVAGMLDPNREKGTKVQGCPILGGEDELSELVSSHNLFGAVVAVGDNFLRALFTTRVREQCPNFPLVTVVHPMAMVSDSCSIGEGVVVMPGASIGPGCSVGRSCILNTGASLDHDSSMGDYSSVGPQVATGGGCRIGPYSAIGIGAVLLHQVEIGAHTVIGGGALVLESIGSHRVAYGSPAMVVRSRKEGEKYL